MEGNVDKQPIKVVQTEKVLRAKEKMQEILAKNKKPEGNKKPEEPFEITPQMRREAEINRLKDGNLD